MGKARSSVPRFRRTGEAPNTALTEDDIAVLHHVHRHRFVRTSDLYLLFPHRSADRLSRRLATLYRAGFLDRPIAQIDRFRSGGSQALVYGLDTAGARFLAEQGASVRGDDWKTRNRSYTRENLDHTLAVAGFMIEVELACRAREDVTFVPFDELRCGAPEWTQALAQPNRWPVMLPWQGRSASVVVAPDAIFGLRKVDHDGNVLRSYYFVEVDRGSMTIAPSETVRRSDAFLYRSSVLRKLLAYGVSHRDGTHQRHLGIPAARVLLVTTTASRAEEMRRVYQQLIGPHLPHLDGLFLFRAPGGGSPLEHGWHTAAGDVTGLLE